MDGKIKGYLLTAAVVLLTIGIYNSFFKSFAPTAVRSFVGLG